MASSSSVPPSASPGANKFHFLVVVQDNPDSREVRMKTRPEHFKQVPEKVGSGEWKVGGALLKDVPKDPEDVSTWDFWGSTLVCVAGSRQEVLDKLRADAYATSGTWDMNSVQIYPFKPAFKMQD
ncbi:hypothetical protein N3K66_005104 [Trichothecium roseum]|uniref:Uncharacterized protein n=1 Tax=Trichothecium roseum TaxID=47278 RepID=A0ACC0V3G7_9HYPO|nr:hypothetical protein N3K66_005104 [Trichothecium roseum]